MGRKSLSKGNEILTFSKIYYNAKLRILVLMSFAPERSRYFDLGEEWCYRPQSRLSTITTVLQLVWQSSWRCGAKQRPTQPICFKVVWVTGEWVMRESTFLTKGPGFARLHSYLLLLCFQFYCHNCILNALLWWLDAFLKLRWKWLRSAVKIGDCLFLSSAWFTSKFCSVSEQQGKKKYSSY